MNFDLIYNLIITSGVWSCSLRHSTFSALENKITVSLALTHSHHSHPLFTASMTLWDSQRGEVLHRYASVNASANTMVHTRSLYLLIWVTHGIYTIALLSVYMQRAHALPPISYWQDPPIKSSVFGYLQQQSHDMNSRFMKGWIYGTLHARVFRPWRYLYRYTSRRHNNLTTCTTQI